jgi:hypothetical protein
LDLLSDPLLASERSAPDGALGEGAASSARSAERS